MSSEVSSGEERASRAELIAAARAARSRAYAPYSRFQVGAALRGESGAIYVGVNVENASYPAGTCAERSAVSAAVSAGERRFVALAISTDTDEPVSPCGLCRQTLREFVETLPITLAPEHGEATEVELASLLPHGFGRANLWRAVGRHDEGDEPG